MKWFRSDWCGCGLELWITEVLGSGCSLGLRGQKLLTEAVAAAVCPAHELSNPAPLPGVNAGFPGGWFLGSLSRFCHVPLGTKRVW